MVTFPFVPNVVSIDPSSAESLPQKHLRLISTLFRKKVLLHAFLQICTLLILTLFAAVLCNLIIMRFLPFKGGEETQ